MAVERDVRRHHVPRRLNPLPFLVQVVICGFVIMIGHSQDQSTNSAVVTVQKSVKVRVCIQKRGCTVITVTHTIINFRDLFVVAVVFAFKFKPTNLL